MLEYIHKDKLGQELFVGDTVVYIRHGTISLGYVKKSTPKRVQVLPYETKGYITSSPQIPHRVIKIEPHSAVTHWILTKK